MQPVYWTVLNDFSSLFILCSRVVMSAVFTCLFLACTGHFRDYLNVFKDPGLMKYLVPAAFFLACDWGVFIWATTNGHVLDTSIGYYMNPMLIFLSGVLIFRERGHVLEFIGILIAFAGVVISTVEYGSFPVISMLCATFWPIYATIKKAAKAGAIVSIAVESTLLTPFALACALIFCRGNSGFATVSWSSFPAIMGTGIITAVPMVLYTYTINELPFKLTGVLQYLCCTISFVCGVLFLHERVTPAKLIMFGFIWAGLVLFTMGSFKRHAQEMQSEALKSGGAQKSGEISR